MDVFYVIIRQFMQIRFLKKLLCLIVAVALASAAREILPPLWGGVKAPALFAVAAYYAVRREAGWGLAAAIWCGVMQDALDGLGWAFGAPLFAGFWALCVFVVKKQMPDDARTCAAAALALAVTHDVVAIVALRSADFTAGIGAGQFAVRVATLIPAAALAAFAVNYLARRADMAMGNINEEKFTQSYETL